VVLAGYMALLDAAFIARFRDRIVNVHPALLPAFPGVRAIEQALEYGVRVFGVTVHLVDEGVDTGPIILQGSVELPRAPDAAEVHEALRPIEHRLLCEAVRLLARGAVRRESPGSRRLTVER
jgi:phosphoribosylglycinamide formyltransferase-1